MSHDTTGPVKVNETKSLFLLILLLALVAGGIALALHFNKIPSDIAPHLPVAATIPAPAAPPGAVAARPRNQPQRRRPPQNRNNEIPEGFSHPRDTLTLIRAGNIYVSITVNNKNINVARTHPQNDNTAFFLSALQRLIHDPKTQAHYDTTADQIAALKTLPLKSPELTSEQQKALLDLYKTWEAAKDKPAEKAAAEKALIQAVGKMPLPPAEQKALDQTLDQARELLRPDQLDLLENNK